MESREIAILVAVLAAVGYRLYKKYGNKGNINTGSGTKPKNTSFPSSSKDEEYEPYSKK
jgi:hypothetical protein